LAVSRLSDDRLDKTGMTPRQLRRGEALTPAEGRVVEMNSSLGRTNVRECANANNERPPANRRASLNYVKELDGIRGVAIACVMLFHFGYLPVGWIGVQFFFVLSGYLITTILLNDRVTDLRRFYWRRTLRIFPLYYFFLLATTVFYILVGIPRAFSSDWPWLFAYASNFARLREIDLPTYVHTWSLAVEEQFYLVWPITILLLSALRIRMVVLILLICVPLLRLVIFHWLVFLDYGRDFAGRTVYSLPFTQFDAFAAGAAITVFRLQHLRNAAHWFILSVALAAVCGLLILSIDHIFYRSAFFGSFGFPMFLVNYHEYVWGYSLINAIAAIGIICALQKVYFTRLLNLPALSRLGKISYGVYVYHLPLLLAGQSLFVENAPAGRAVFFILWVAITVLVSELSFRYLETPFLKLKNAVDIPPAIRAQLRSE
jgi:peptidoglycan/LPS O-acetylase OafA/YrhL